MMRNVELQSTYNAKMLHCQNIHFLTQMCIYSVVFGVISCCLAVSSRRLHCAVVIVLTRNYTVINFVKTVHNRQSLTSRHTPIW